MYFINGYVFKDIQYVMVLQDNDRFVIHLEIYSQRAMWVYTKQLETVSDGTIIYGERSFLNFEGEDRHFKTMLKAVLCLHDEEAGYMEDVVRFA